MTTDREWAQKVAAEVLRKHTPGAKPKAEPKPRLEPAMEAMLSDWLQTEGNTVESFFSEVALEYDMSEYDLSSVGFVPAEKPAPLPKTGIIPEPAKNDTLERAQKAHAKAARGTKDPTLYRDGRDRAKAAAERDAYDGLAALVLQGQRTDDRMLELACWDECVERDKTSTDAWLETVQMCVDMQLVSEAANA